MTLTCWEERNQAAAKHEQMVKQQLEIRGWYVRSWGQGIMDDVVKSILRAKSPVVLWRWLPDLIATKGKKIYLIDAKTDIIKNTPNFSVELHAVIAHKAMSPLGLRIIYVFDDMSCNVPERLIPIRWTIPPDEQDCVISNGSGTPYILVRKCDQIPMDTVFGKPLTTIIPLEKTP